MNFTTLNWIALIFMIVSIMWTNFRIDNQEFDKLKEELAQRTMNYENALRESRALIRMIENEGYTYEGGISYSSADGSYFNYHYKNLKKVRKE